MVDLSDSIFNKTPGLDATRTSDLSPAPSRAREAAPRLLSCRLAQPRRCSRSRLPPQVTFLAARRRSPPPHPLVIAQTGPRTGIASSPHLCAQPHFIRFSSTHPPPSCKPSSPASTHKEGHLHLRPSQGTLPVTGQAAVTMEPEGKAPDTVSAIIITMPP